MTQERVASRPTGTVAFSISLANVGTSKFNKSGKKHSFEYMENQVKPQSFEWQLSVQLPEMISLFICNRREEGAITGFVDSFTIYKWNSYRLMGYLIYKSFHFFILIWNSSTSTYQMDVNFKTLGWSISTVFPGINKWDPHPIHDNICFFSILIELMD